MRIGELSDRTGASVRSLRHYEASGLLSPQRLGNGYREFPEQAVQTVTRIRALLAAGLSLAVIREVLPCVQNTDLAVESCDSLTRVLRCELDKIDARADELHRARTAISAMLTGP
ncbi:MerR family transcriptional regulator [Kineosporia sp. J2-2]|uniref:MerR family transcriptional regulator n=1 Tax=Kineosporia corallincola TaxID=2835133 RepID=A0ABS5TND1_9ACTN|nr:MerR family transcriptional regulator [Kineosporia corallincola]MBT0772602.1 MerR family transcriptional regulator [Kineosporia corallincola]